MNDILAPANEVRRLTVLPGNDEPHLHRALEAFAKECETELGLAEGPRIQWADAMLGASFTKAERPEVTMLLGGLTIAHDKLVRAAFSHLGYRVQPLDCPDSDALRVGKEYGNRAQCNPTYFTVGNLVKYLIELRDVRGLTTAEIEKNYVFLTAGACGPCRFGMYTTEYRKALRDAGFSNFRVMIFQQQGGLKQATGPESGLELSPQFFIGLLKALIVGDILNALGYRLRPYEVRPGSTDDALSDCQKLLEETLEAGRPLLPAMRRVRQRLSWVEVDRTQPKPKVSIIGEFWAMTTEGDGNYRLQRFLEEQGAEADIQLVTAWLLYNIWEVAYDTVQRADLSGTDAAGRGLGEMTKFQLAKRSASLWAAEHALRTAFGTLAKAGGLDDYHLPNMLEIEKEAHGFYDAELRGGEGHMEVAKLILNEKHRKATMTLSVKPFGCMPSSGVSDGVQSAVTERFPGAIFCAVETSGDGAVNFQSRVQMFLHKAKQAAQREAEEALATHGLTHAEFVAEVRRSPTLRHPLHRAPHAGTTSTADLIAEVGHLRARRSLSPLGRVLQDAGKLVKGIRFANGRSKRGDTATAFAHSSSLAAE